MRVVYVSPLFFISLKKKQDVMNACLPCFSKKSPSKTKIELILTRVSHHWCIYASAPDPLGPWRFNSGSTCPSTPIESELSFAILSKRAAGSQTFWRLSNTDAPCTCIDGPFRPHFARARVKGKRSFRTDWQHLAPLRTFGRSISDLQMICQISRLISLIFDRWLRMPCPVAE